MSQIAARNGDRDYLMLDKAHGKIIAFQQGQADLRAAAALTGREPSDYLAPDAFSLSFAQQKGLKYNITPAGRYTVSVGYTRITVRRWTSTKCRGQTGISAIHRVWLGAPSEHRDLRLRRPGTTISTSPMVASTSRHRRCRGCWIACPMQTIRCCTFCRRTRPWFRGSFRSGEAGKQVAGPAG